jgi:hypothetical protein
MRDHIYTFTADPDHKPSPNKWQREEQDRLKAKLADPRSSYVEDGVLRWHSNDAVVPPHVFRDAGFLVPERQQRAYDEELEKFLTDYRKRQPARPSAEERFEARAAFGPGVEVVDIISGRRYTT